MTSHFNKNVSGDDLNKLIEKTEEYLSVLIELKQLRSSGHRPVWWENRPKSINKKMTAQYTVVKCSCGHTTKYKVPLTTLDDFECPRKNRKENCARKV
jgi:hypothetical protein